VKRGFLVAIAGAAVIVIGLAGCGGKKQTESTVTTTATGSASGTGTASAGTGKTKVTIDGQDQSVSGSVVCTTMNGTVNIAIGEATTGIAAVLSDANPPEVKSVGLGNVNGVALGYQSGVNQGNSEATKDGNSYKITGTATGVDMSNPLQPVNKPFEIDVTCP
jgi:lipoprotein LpqH